MAKRKNNNTGWKIIAILMILVVLVSGAITINDQLELGAPIPTWSEIFAGAGLKAPTGESSAEVHFLDVGQADATLILSGGEVMLIDAGEKSEGEKIVKYLNDLGIEKLDVALGTHAHSDHIGGMAEVLRNFPVEKIFLQKSESDTRTYEDLLLTIDEQGIPLTEPKANESFPLGEMEITLFVPEYDGGEENNNSIVVRGVCGGSSFLFMGDAETEVESQMITAGFGQKSDVLKVGHHGSNTSTGQRFLDFVDPGYAVISVGADNTYGHPSVKITGRLEDKGVAYYRTDVNGGVMAVTDGTAVEFFTEN